MFHLLPQETVLLCHWEKAPLSALGEKTNQQKSESIRVTLCIFIQHVKNCTHEHPPQNRQLEINGNEMNKMNLAERPKISSTFIEPHSREKRISDLWLIYSCLFSCCDLQLDNTAGFYFTELPLKGSFESGDQTWLPHLSVWADVWCLLIREPSAGSGWWWWFISILPKDRKELDISYIRC